MALLSTAGDSTSPQLRFKEQELELRDANSKVDAQARHIAQIEKQYNTQCEDMKRVLNELDRERFRVAEAARDGAVTETVQMMRRKQDEVNAQSQIAHKIQQYDKLTGSGQASTPESVRILRDIKEMIEAASTLPPGWEEATSPEGLSYYIDHTNEVTTWVRPTVGMSSILRMATGWVGEVDVAQGAISHTTQPLDDSTDGYIDVNPDEREFIAVNEDHPQATTFVGVTKPRKKKGRKNANDVKVINNSTYGI